MLVKVVKNACHGFPEPKVGSSKCLVVDILFPMRENREKQQFFTPERMELENIWLFWGFKLSHKMII